MTNIFDITEVRKGQFTVSFNCDFCGMLSMQQKSHFDRNVKHYCCRDCYSEDRKTWTKEDQHRYGTGLPTEERKKRARIRSMTNKAIKRGELKRKPCEKCGDKAEAHHDVYDTKKPFDVRWLCFKHHREWHKENPELL